jgi:hypothetical protein
VPPPINTRIVLFARLDLSADEQVVPVMAAAHATATDQLRPDTIALEPFVT